MSLDGAPSQRSLLLFLLSSPCTHSSAGTKAMPVTIQRPFIFHENINYGP